MNVEISSSILLNSSIISYFFDSFEFVNDHRVAPYQFQAKYSQNTYRFIFAHITFRSVLKRAITIDMNAYKRKEGTNCAYMNLSR